MRKTGCRPLGACITYSFTHLTEQAKRLLPAVSIFQGVADQDVLAAFSTVEGVPHRFAGVSQEEWTAVLEDAARVGLLTGIGMGMYRIHPALPGYLAAGWQAAIPDDYGQEREICERALCTASAYFSRWLSGQFRSGNAALAYALIGLQGRRTLGAMLGSALDRHAWDDASGIVRALDPYWDTRGLSQEATAWSDRILGTIAGPGEYPREAARSLWLYTTDREAARHEAAGHLDQAAQTYHQALAYLQSQPEDEWTRASTAITYGHLGNTAHRSGQLDEAEDWERKSLVIGEDLGNRPGMARTYHQLGVSAKGRGRLDEAEDWYRKSLAIKSELGDHAGMARTYAQLGLLAEGRDQAPLALEWNIRCVTLFSQFPSPLTGTGPIALARLTRQLGMPALEQTWQQVTGQPLSQAARDYVTSQPDEAPEAST
jgi:tetratricopeptide (TPR) repeat protein